VIAPSGVDSTTCLNTSGKESKAFKQRSFALLLLLLLLLDAWLELASPAWQTVQRQAARQLGKQCIFLLGGESAA
jgi:hypothetical protein